MGNASNTLPPLREEYQLKEFDRKAVDRIREELEHRLGVNITCSVYTETPLIHPVPSLSLIYLELKVGNWRRIHTISEAELDRDGVFIYFLRRTADACMMDLIRIGAQRA